MPITTTQAVDTLDANLGEIWLDGREASQKNEEYSKVFNVLSSDKQTERDSYMSGFGLAPAKPEGQAATYDTLYPGIKEDYTHVTYALGYEITEEAIEDNLYSPQTFDQLPQSLNDSFMETVETTAFNVFNNGFTTNGFDAVPLFSASHPTLDGGTVSNRPTTHVDLSVTSLTAGVTAFEKFTGERGLKRPAKPEILLIPVDSWNIAEELLKSEYKPYSGNNEKNALQSKNLRYLDSKFLTDTDAWFLLAGKNQTKLKFFWRVKLGALRKSTDFDSTNLKHLARARFSVGYSHWMGTYGTSGG